MQYINQNPLQTNQWSYTNNTNSAQNIIVTLNGGDGALSKSTWVESNWTQYWSAGARGVSVQCFINDTLQEVAQGGLGNPQSVANQKVYSHTEGYKCGRYWYGAVKWCDRDVYVWGSQRAFPRGGSGDTKSFALNLRVGEVLKIVFVGGANITNTLFNGSVSLSFIPQIAPVIPEPLPEVEPSPKPPETELPEVDSNENPDNTEQNLPALSREQILAYQSFLSDFMQFFTQNQNQKITENMTFLDYYNANKSEANEPYESFLSSQLMANGGSIVMRDFLADFMQSTESELQEFFANMPQTQHKDGDLLDLSYFELIALLENEQGGDSSQENGNTDGDSSQEPPIVEPESPQEQEPTISVEKREKAKAVVAMFDEFKSFWINNKTHTAKIGRFTMTLEQFHYRQTNGDLTPPYDEFVTYFLESQSLSNAWTFFHHASVELGEIFAKVPDTWVDGENLLELTYPQLLEIANGGKGDLSGESEPNLETQEPQTQEEKLARIMSEFLSVKKTFTDYHNLIRQNQNPSNNATPTTPEQIQAEKNNQLIFDWFMSWLIDPTHTAELEDMPKSQGSTIQQGEAAMNQALAKWVLKIPNLNEIYTDLQGKGMSYTLDEFKIMLVCFFDSVNQYKDSFENERNRYVEIYAMPEIRALIDELEKLEAEIA